MKIALEVHWIPQKKIANHGFQVRTRCMPKIPQILMSIAFQFIGNVAALESSTKFGFSASYDLKTAKLPWKCLSDKMLDRQQSQGS